ncbi:N4bp2l1 [Symbiodinium natans]|uniref:N4bp2l1 protein n=1 Tax=Symbiodinium natans TaxID=878477 RepID=A0A812TZW1_9DINO|nr:N4bp2l1 [Symbiodinium natans]
MHPSHISHALESDLQDELISRSAGSLAAESSISEREPELPQLRVEGLRLVAAQWSNGGIERDSDEVEYEMELPPMVIRLSRGMSPSHGRWYLCPLIIAYADAFGTDLADPPVAHVYLRQGVRGILEAGLCEAGVEIWGADLGRHAQVFLHGVRQVDFSWCCSGDHLVAGQEGGDSWKSTFARAWLARALKTSSSELEERPTWRQAHVCSSDDFCTHLEDGEEVYDFDSLSARTAHTLNEQRVDIAMRLGTTPIIVDNTNMELWEMQRYVALAKSYTYAVRVVEPGTFNPDWRDVVHLMHRNAQRAQAGKNVPVEVLKKMLGRYQPFLGDLGAISGASRPDLADSDGWSQDLRIDPTDGCSYTLQDFVEEYGGTEEDPPREWFEAMRAPRVSKTKAKAHAASSRESSDSSESTCSRSSKRRRIQGASSRKLALEALWRDPDLTSWAGRRRKMEEHYQLEVQEDEMLCIVSANHSHPLWSGEDHQLLRENRGTVYEKSSGRAVCLPFYKFWNRGERLTEEIDWSDAIAEEKIDGNLMKLFFFEGTWRLASNRTLKVHELNDKYACTGRTNYQLFAEAAANSSLDYARLDPGCCYMFERVHPDFRIVLDYPQAMLYHIGTRDMRTLKEVDVDIGVPRPKRWEVRSATACQALLDSFHGFCEGLVVRDAKFRRQKWKRREYLLMHSARYLLGDEEPCYAWVARSSEAGRMNVDRLCLNVWLRSESSEFAAYFPEALERYHTVQRLLEGVCDGLGDTLREREPGSGRFLHEATLWERLQAGLCQDAKRRVFF